MTHRLPGLLISIGAVLVALALGAAYLQHPGTIALLDIPLNTVWWVGPILVCPFSHILMMKYMPNEHGPSSSTDHHPNGGTDHG